MRGYISLLFGASVVFAGKLNILWNKTSDVGPSDKAYSVAVDTVRETNIYVAGEAFTTDPEFRGLNYSNLGMLMWNEAYPRGTSSSAMGVAAYHDSVYFAGYTYNGTDDDLYLVKCNLTGDTVWTRTYDNGRNERASNVVIDSYNNAYVTGSSFSNDTSGIITIKYEYNGDTAWIQTYDISGYDVVNDIYLVSNFIYLAGYTKNGSDEDFRVMKYDLDGSLQWNRVLDSGEKDIAYGVAVDASGNVYVAGRHYETDQGDIWVVKCDINGDTIWTRVFDGGNDDGAYDIDVCDERIYVVGYSNNGSDDDFIILRFRDNGDTVWSNRYDSGDDDIARSLVLLNEYLYVTGIYDNGVNSDFRTMKFQEKDITLLSPNGYETWTVGSNHDILWNWLGGIDSVLLEYRNESTLGFDTIGVVPNTGSYSWEIPNTPGILTRVFISAQGDYSEVRDSSDRYFTIENTSLEEKLYEPAPLSLQLSGSAPVTIEYDIPVPGMFALRIYSSDGRLVRDLTSQAKSMNGRLSWNGCDGKNSRLPRGVYFIQLKTSSSGTISRRFVLN